MKNILFLILISISFTAEAQIKADTTFTAKALKALNVMEAPTDTIFSKVGLAIKNSVLYTGNGIRWNPSTGQNLWAANGNNIFNTNTGNVGIGITTPDANAKLDVTGSIYASNKIVIGTKDIVQIGSYALAVNGDAIFKKVKVKLYGNWADFVFDDNYELPTLTDVDQFIKHHRHLPGVPSAKEVAENGIDFEESQTVLLKKVEELTLYMIEMDKEVKKLRKENEEIRKRLK